MRVIDMLRPPPTFPFLSQHSRTAVLADYDRRVARLPVPVERRLVPTRFGDAHVLVAGPPDAPPVLALHGLNMGAPRNMDMFLPLTHRFQVYAPDTPGQPGPSTPARLAWRRHEYGRWVGDLLDGLALDNVAAVGVSFGGAILLDAAICIPERIHRAALLVPAGITRVDFASVLAHLVLPAIAYRLFRRTYFLRRQVGALASEVTDDLLEMFDMISSHVFPHREPPATFSPAHLRHFRSPTLVIAARHDLFFPLRKVQLRAPHLLPNLVGLHVLPGRHIPSMAEKQHLNELILSFLDGSTP